MLNSNERACLLGFLKHHDFDFRRVCLDCSCRIDRVITKIKTSGTKEVKFRKRHFTMQEQAMLSGFLRARQKELKIWCESFDLSTSLLFDALRRMVG